MNEEVKSEEQKDSKLTVKEAFNFNPVLGISLERKILQGRVILILKQCIPLIRYLY